MTTYIPLSQKYRPKTFDDIVGQRVAVGVVSGMITAGKIPPTYLLQGPRSSGKTSLGRLIGRRLNCLRKDNKPNPCLTCDSCKETLHPDIMELNAASERGIDLVRRLEMLSKLAPTYRKRVFILDEVANFTPQAFQASLKLFEEPPSHVCFILATTDPQKMPETILSRCSILTLRPIATLLLAKHLAGIAKKEKAELKKEQALLLAQASKGHPREAISMLEQAIALSQQKDLSLKLVVDEVVANASRQFVSNFLKALLKQDVKEAFTLLSKSELGREEVILKECVDMLQALMRFSIEPKLVGLHWRGMLKPLKGAHHEDVAELLRTFALAYQEARNYKLDAATLLDLAIVEGANSNAN